MWRKQPEAKPSSPVTPAASDYVNPNQRPPAPFASSPSLPAPSAQAPRSDAAVLTRGIRIKGELTGKADLVIDGEVDGSIRLGDSRLTIGQAGHIRAHIEAAEIFVKGQVEGNLRGRERVILGSSCHVIGDLESPRVAIEEGARFKGRVEMGPSADAREHQSKRVPQAATAPPRPTSASEPSATPVRPSTQASAPTPVTVETNRNS
ncbi:MAG TPA: polymer-forming cytoskeletal protein [Candidatus Acidoferrales bacterium]|nr:polymer-forming cytoskeletal protein [Candidatus Acidoferrales bacterium]